MIHLSAYWLALANHSGLKLSKIKPIAQQWHLMEGKSIEQLFNLSATELTLRFNISEAEAQGVLNAAKAHKSQVALLEQWEKQGIKLLTLSHPDYPMRLIYSLPPQHQPLLLWTKGNTKLLSEASITVLGNPDPSEEIVTFINELAAILVEEDICIVSGYGKGLDRTAFETMLATEKGRGVAVLPMGLASFANLTTKLDPLVTEGRAVLVSPFPPDTPYKDNLAEARNILVDSLALALLVPQSDRVSQPRSQAALDRGMPVLVDMTDSPENRALIASGAFLMTDPGEVVEMVQQAIVDDALQAQLVQTPAQSTPPPSVQAPLLNDNDDYALGKEVVDPLGANEALDILSSMGSVPDSLRARLMAMEDEESQADDED